MTDTEDKVLKKVQALLRKAEDNGATEAEQEAAMNAALSLLAKHNLAMTDANGYKSDPVIERGETMRQGPWARQVWNSMGKLYFCAPLFGGWTGNKICHMYGTKTDVAVAIEMCKFVQEAMWRKGLEVKREYGGVNTYLTSFLNAASLRLNTRVGKMIHEASTTGVTDESGSTALVPMSTFEEAWLQAKDAWPDNVVDKKTKMKIRSAMAARAGREFAENINLGRQLKGSSKAILQIGGGA